MPEFSAVIESAGGGGHYVLLPEEITAAIDAKHLMRVAGTLNTTPYRSNLMKSRGRFYLGVHKATLEAAGKATGDHVQVTIDVDNQPRARKPNS